MVSIWSLIGPKNEKYHHDTKKTWKYATEIFAFKSYCPSSQNNNYGKNEKNSAKKYHQAYILSMYLKQPFNPPSA